MAEQRYQAVLSVIEASHGAEHRIVVGELAPVTRSCCTERPRRWSQRGAFTTSRGLAGGLGDLWTRPPVMR